jgi:ankyrin repeat protein
MGSKPVKTLHFVIAAALLASVAPATHAQSPGAGFELLSAVRQRDGAKANDLIASNPPGILNTRDGEGNTPLLIAIAREDADWTGLLIIKGADANLAGKNGDTPLIVAARTGFGDAIDWLLEVGAKVDAPNRMGETPLILAVQQRHAAVVRQLLRAGANPDKPDSAAGFSARDYARRDTRSRQILQLIEARKPQTAASR